MKKIIALILSVAMLCGMTVFAHPFSDVAGHWAEKEIEEAYKNDWVNGNPDGSFRPDRSISRAEFLKMLTALLCTKAETYVPSYYDDGTHWASMYYNFALDNIYSPLGEESKVGEIIPGKMSIENFDLPIERWEMSYLVSEYLKNTCNVVGKDQGEIFSDAAETEKTYPLGVVERVKNTFYLGVMTGDENGDINPGDNGTRAEAVVIVNRVGNIIQDLIDTAKEKTEAYEKQIEESLKTYEEIPEGHPVVTMMMENGKKFMIELYPEYAPQTVANFVALVKEGFYDGLTFHRVIEGFVAQGGDPTGSGAGGSQNNIFGEFAENGFDQNTRSHKKGVISMARSNNKNSATSQFFICYDDLPFLDGNYAAFGKVIYGMNVVDEFVKVEKTLNSSGEMAVPVEPLVIRKATVSK